MMGERDKTKMEAHEQAVQWLMPMLQEELALGGFDGDNIFLLQLLIMKVFGIKDCKDQTTGDIYYVVPDDTALALVANTQKSLPVFRIAASIAALNIRAEKPLPESLRLFAALFLLGKTTAPARKGRQREWDKNLKLYAYVKLVEAQFNLPLTRNDESPAHSACDALAVALEQVGYKIEADVIKARCVSQKFAVVREYYRRFVDELAKGEIAEPPAG